jgi:hypothetical protein
MSNGIDPTLQTVNLMPVSENVSAHAGNNQTAENAIAASTLPDEVVSLQAEVVSLQAQLAAAEGH